MGGKCACTVSHGDKRFGMLFRLQPLSCFIPSHRPLSRVLKWRSEAKETLMEAD